MRWLLLILLLCVFPPAAQAAKTISYAYVDSTPTVEQGSAVSVVITVTNTGDQPFPIRDLGDAAYTGYMSGTGWKFKPSRTALWASTDCLVHSGDSAPPNDECTALGLTPQTAALNVTIGQFIHSGTPDVDTLSANVLVAGANDYAVSLPSSPLIRVAVTSAGSLADLALLLPGPGEWTEVLASFNGWQFGGTCPTGSGRGGPVCTSGGSTIRTTSSEANSANVFGNTGPESTMIAWNGASYDPSSHKWYFHGGGHGDYGGNEFYVIDLEELTFTRLTAPESIAAGCGTGPSTGNHATHTYDGIEWIPSISKILNVANLGFNRPGCSTQSAWVSTFDPATLEWERLNSQGVNTELLAVSAYDALNDRFWTIDGETGVLSTYNFYTGSVETTQNLGGGRSEGHGVAFQGEIFHSGLAAQEEMYRTPMTTSTSRTLIGTLPSGMSRESGCQPRGQFLYCTDGDNDVFRLDVVEGTWTTDNNSSGPTQGNSGNRVYSKWIYIQEIDAFALWHNPDEGVWLYCPEDGCNPPITETFQAECNKAGVIYCDPMNSLPTVLDSSSETVSVFHNSGTCATRVVPEVCPSVVDGYLQFLVKSQSGANASGQYYVQFGDILGCGIGELGCSTTLYIQWKQWFDSDILNTAFTGSNGFKQFDISGPGGSSCTDGEIVGQNVQQRGFLVMYHSCGVSDGWYQFLGGGVTDYQPGGPNQCRSDNLPGSCSIYRANEWMTFQVAMEWHAVGDITMKMWISGEGQAAELVVDHRISNVVEELSGYQRLWLLPYQTGKDSSQVHNEGETRVDELIISTNPIAHPNG